MMLVLLGAPGAGKGTQAAWLAEALGLAHISTGDLFRAHLGERTPLGLAAEAYMTRGELVPDAVVIGMVRDRLAWPDAATGAVLDGFPRTVAQAEALDEMLIGARLPGDGDLRAIELVVSDEVIIDRLSGRQVCRAAGHTYHRRYKPPRVAGMCDLDGSVLYQRPDDTADTVRHRLEVYRREVTPVLAFYEASGRLQHIDGQGEPSEVADRLGAATGEAAVWSS